MHYHLLQLIKPCFARVKIFGQMSKYLWVELRSIGVGLGLVLHMIDMI